ncbi:hypothetical protein LZ30DRAFT_734386 [Colletotrichum cereale]|nr:hypothetical protein LZ30DRAFT_734386 [Colletotrichum cereale]
MCCEHLKFACWPLLPRPLLSLFLSSPGCRVHCYRMTRRRGRGEEKRERETSSKIPKPLGRLRYAVYCVATSWDRRERGDWQNETKTQVPPYRDLCQSSALLRATRPGLGLVRGWAPVPATRTRFRHSPFSEILRGPILGHTTDTYYVGIRGIRTEEPVKSPAPECQEHIDPF